MQKLVLGIAVLVRLSNAQGPLSIGDAISRALENHPAIHAAQAAVNSANERIRSAHSGYLPRVNVEESYQRSNNPVFVFGSLLMQHQFGSGNFEIGPLNRPDSIQNFRSVVNAEQTVYDGGRTRGTVRSAELATAQRAEDQRGSKMNVIAHVARAYYDALLSRETLRVSDEAVRSAEADLKRAQDVRQAGMSTDADALSIRVHLASVREQWIQRNYETQTTLAALNDAMGLPLETAHSLTSTLIPLPADSLVSTNSALERPELNGATIAVQMSVAQAETASARYKPEVLLRLSLESDARNLVQKGGVNWFAGATLQWNLFNGFSDRAAVREAAYAKMRAESNRQEVDSSVRLQVKRAAFEWQGATERVSVSEGAVAMAAENLRIVKNRYEAGLITVTELLRSEVALSDARSRRLIAIEDQRIAALSVALASGRLSPSSEGLR